MANSWRRERWDSLRLLTPNWQSRLPGLRYDGPDPDGYMTMGEVIEFIERFAARPRAPVRTGTNVTSVRRTDDGYQRDDEPRRDSLRGPWSSPAAPATVPRVPAFAAAVPAVGRAADAVGLPRPGQAARRRRARRRSVGDRRAAGRRAAAVGPAGDALGRRARTAAAHVPRPRRAVVDGRVGRVGPAVRRGRRSQPGPAAALAAARRDARAGDARSQRAHRDRRRAGRPLGGRPRRPRAVLRRPAQRLLARRPQDGAPARTRSTSGP